MTAAETSGWSPRATSTAPASAPIAANPTWSELDRPRSGSGLTTRRALPHSMAASMRSASCPRTTTDSPTPASATASSTCWRTDRPAMVASSLPPPKRDPAPAASTSPTVPLVISASSHCRAAGVALRTVGADHPRGRRPMRREAVTDDHRARTDARRRPARSHGPGRGGSCRRPAAPAGVRPADAACLRCRVCRRRHRPDRKPGGGMDVRLRRR